ncbi:hypothetical protein ACWDV4_10140 [Micromonospora sp. NPDC003197]
MAVRRGLLEALVLYALGLVIALLGAGAWTLADDGSFRWRFGVLLIAGGVLLTLTGGGLQLSRLETREVRAFLGAQPEREDATGGQVLTGIGIFLFVAVPLIATGVLVMGSIAN